MGIFTKEEHMEYDEEEKKMKWKTDKKGLSDRVSDIKSRFQKSDFDKEVAQLEKKQKLEAKLANLKERAQKAKKQTQTQKLKQDIQNLKQQQRSVRIAKTKHTINKIDKGLDYIFGPVPKKRQSYDIFGSPMKTTNYKSPFGSPPRPKTSKKKKSKKKSSNIFNPSGIDWGL